MRTLIVQEALGKDCEGKLGVFKKPKVFHVMNTLPKGLAGKSQRFKLVGVIEKSEANAV